MKIHASLPFDHIDPPEEFQTPEAVTEVSALLERLGFDGGNVTDHPVPTGRWLDAGGHYAQDPFVLLAFVAAATKNFTLQTGILVLPYRNPFITARAVATLDVFSKGRVQLGVGTGYLKGEYRALGVDFERRNEIVDEYIKALKAAWSNEEFTFQGTGYQALGNRIKPQPVQKPHPPILIGGNSNRALRRAAELGDAWYPFYTPPGLSTTSRTASLSNEEDLVRSIRYLHEHCEKIGREKPPEIVIGSALPPGVEVTPQALIDGIGRLTELGLSCAALPIAGKTRAEYCDNAARLSSDVLSKLSRD
jgi:probable F420-dependent oxidoreductase